MFFDKSKMFKLIQEQKRPIILDFFINSETLFFLQIKGMVMSFTFPSTIPGQTNWLFNS